MILLIDIQSQFWNIEISTVGINAQSDFF